MKLRKLEYAHFHSQLPYSHWLWILRSNSIDMRAIGKIPEVTGEWYFFRCVELISVIENSYQLLVTDEISHQNVH